MEPTSFVPQKYSPSKALTHARYGTADAIRTWQIERISNAKKSIDRRHPTINLHTLTEHNAMKSLASILSIAAVIAPVAAIVAFAIAPSGETFAAIPAAIIGSMVVGAAVL